MLVNGSNVCIADRRPDRGAEHREETPKGRRNIRAAARFFCRPPSGDLAYITVDESYHDVPQPKLTYLSETNSSVIWGYWILHVHWALRDTLHCCTTAVAL